MLKLKYRNGGLRGSILHRPWDPPQGTEVFKAKGGKVKSRENNSHPGKRYAKKKLDGRGVRRRVYLGFVRVP